MWDLTFAAENTCSRVCSPLNNTISDKLVRRKVISKKSIPSISSMRDGLPRRTEKKRTDGFVIETGGGDGGGGGRRRRRGN